MPLTVLEPYDEGMVQDEEDEPDEDELEEPPAPDPQQEMQLGEVFALPQRHTEMQRPHAQELRRRGSTGSEKGVSRRRLVYADEEPLPLLLLLLLP